MPFIVELFMKYCSSMSCICRIYRVPRTSKASIYSFQAGEEHMSLLHQDRLLLPFFLIGACGGTGI